MFYFCSGEKLLVGQTFLSDCKEQTSPRNGSVGNVCSTVFLKR